MCLTLRARLLLLELGNLSLSLLYLKVINRILLLDFHEYPSELYAFVEILEDLLFDAFYFLSLLDPSTVAHLSFLSYKLMWRVDWYYNFALVITIAALILESKFELFDLLPQIINDILVLADMDGD